MTQTEGPWTKWGVVIALGAALVTYTGTATQLRWFPFSHSIRPPFHSTSPSPTVPPSSSSPPAPIETATVLSATSLGLDSCGCYYQYSIRVDLVDLEGKSPVLDWWTVYSASGLDAGTSGDVTANSVLYNNDTWTTIVDVKAPAGAVDGDLQWYTKFAVYAPDGTELAEYP
jgi:hypothetical protein